MDPEVVAVIRALAHIAKTSEGKVLMNFLESECLIKNSALYDQCKTLDQTTFVQGRQAFRLELLHALQTAPSRLDSLRKGTP